MIEYSKRLFERTCKRCNSSNVGTAGTYKIKTYPFFKQRYRCYDCKSHFTPLDLFHGKRHVNTKINDLILFYSTQFKEAYNKFDNKKRLTYSTREIVKIIRKNHRLKVGKTYVWQFLKRN